MEIIDNFLDYSDFLLIKNNIMSNNFPWYFVDYKVREGDDNYQFVHYLYRQHSRTSEFFDIINPALAKLNAKSLIRIKCNLVTKTEKIIIYDMHEDQDYDCKTSILYMNSNNGYTKFESGEIVNSVENRMVIFPTLTNHTGTSCTDEKVRVVINFNYF